MKAGFLVECFGSMRMTMYGQNHLFADLLDAASSASVEELQRKVSLLSGDREKHSSLIGLRPGRLAFCVFL